LRKEENGQALVAHACNPNYSGGTDQDCGLKPAQVSLQTPNLKKYPAQKGLVTLYSSHRVST
jgi:hypothetical protein